MKSAFWLIEALFILLPLCACGYYLLCLWGARQFLRRPVNSDFSFTPPISILKPLKGMDPEIYAICAVIACRNIRKTNHFLALSDATTHHRVGGVVAARVSRTLHPAYSLSGNSGGNIRSATWVQMAPHARYGHWLVNVAISR